MSQTPFAGRLAVWPVAPARALAAALADAVTETVEMEPHEARAALDEGRVDLALLPTLEVLRHHDGLEIVPNVALVGERSPRRQLVVVSPLDQIQTIAFDPRDAQEALLAQLVVREHYGTQPVFRLAVPGTPLADVLAGHDAALVPLDAEGAAGTSLPPAAVVLDPAQEWVELTLRPVVWGLLAARAGTLAPPAAARLGALVAEAEPGDRVRVDGIGTYQLTLDGYGMEGLDELVEHLFATGTLAEMPQIPFAALPEPPAGDAADADG